MNKSFLIIGVILLLVIGVVFTIKPKPAEQNTSDSTPALSGKNPNQTTDTSSSDPVRPEVRYQTYNQDEYQRLSDSRRVLFFHASWCPTCRAANRMFEQNISKIPEDLVIFKTDYDSQTELKQKYAVTYQHTFVQVDENGNEIVKWNGGDVDELLANIK